MIDINKIDFKKGHGLVPVIAQDVDTQKVLMMGYANEEAIQVSQKSGKLTFFSRSKNRLWTKGEESGNFLEIISMALDCDVDTIPVSYTHLANPSKTIFSHSIHHMACIRYPQISIMSK